ncbi:hypothetical protein EDB84DRAFT_1495817 [Lactarius hengduanensis]|nr:hypothetical protein EDB84DRAFT_1495817 [Lactarius hengduanensis]
METAGRHPPIMLSTNTTTFLLSSACAISCTIISQSATEGISGTAGGKPCIGVKATSHVSTRASYRCTSLSWGLSRMGRDVDVISLRNLRLGNHGESCDLS